MTINNDPRPSNKERQTNGKFGSGNKLSHDRKSGSRNKSTVAALPLMDGEAEKLSRRGIELTSQGDVAALRMCLDRVVPPHRDCPEKIPMERIETAADACLAISDLIEAVAAGELAPSEADAVSALIERRAKLAELDDIEQHLSSLEKAAR
ncbi:MAG: hypothetical protein ACKOPC_03850 [Methylocystis sp.]